MSAHPDPKHGRAFFAALLVLSVCMLAGSASPGLSKEAEPETPTGAIDYFIPISYQANGLTLAASKLFINRSCAGELYGAPTFVGVRLTGSSSSSTDLYTNWAGCAPTGSGAGHVLSINTAADDTYDYWLTLNGKVVRNRHNGAPFSTPAILSSMQDSTPDGDPTTFSIAVNATDVIWNEGVYFYKTTRPEAGGACMGIPCYLFASTNLPRKLVAVDPASPRILFLDGNILRSFNLEFYDSFSIADHVSDFYVDGAWIYFAQKSGDSYQLRSVNLYNYAWFQTHYTSPADPSLQASKIAAGGGRLYWYERQGAFGGQIFMLTPPSGERSAQSDTLQGVVSMVADSNYLYWLTQASPGGGVFRLTPGAAAPNVPGDMSITGMRFTQAMQVDGNLIPLVGRKATMVRLLVASTPGAQGAWQNVRARLDVEGSAVPHFADMAQLPAASDEKQLNQSFNFMLSEAETIEGTRHFTATLFSMSGRREDNRLNNIYSSPATFGPARELRVPVFEYSNINRGTHCDSDHADGYVTPWENVISHTIDTQGAWPVNMLTLYPIPGVEWPSFDDSNCGAYLTAKDWMIDWIDRTYPSGGQKVVIMQPDSGHPGGTCWPSSNGNSVINVQDYFKDHALAHEFGHAYPGVYRSGHTWDASSHYPRAGEPGIYFRWNWMGDFIGMSTFTTTRLVIGTLHPTTPTHDAYDLMSYGPNSWPSPYTYCKTLKYMSGGSVCCPDTVEGGCSSPDMPADGPAPLPRPAQYEPGSVNAGMPNNAARPDLDLPYLYVSGWITSTSEAAFKPFEIINSSKHIATADSGTTYHIKLLDKFASTLYESSFDAIATHQDNFDLSGPVPAPSLFSAYLPWDSNTKTITLEYKGSVIAQRTVSDHAPLNAVQAFSPTEPVTGTWKLSWIASDQDADPLVYSVWYSPNNGNSWLPVAMGLPDSSQSTSIHFNLLPGSNVGEGRLRVLASDGVLTTESRTGTAFTVQRKPPSINLLPSYAADGHIALIQAMVTDPEDGVISDPASIHWLSDWDGTAYTGVILNTDQLAPGDHNLSVSVYDSDGLYGTASIRVHVPGNPAASGLLADASHLGTLVFDAVLPMTLTVPAGAVSQPVRFNARIAADTYIDPPGAVGPSFEIDATLVDGTPVHSYKAALTLVIDYSDASYVSKNESNASVYAWNPDTFTWEKQETQVDIIHHRATATLKHTSQFVLVMPYTTRVYLPVLLRK